MVRICCKFGSIRTDEPLKRRLAPIPQQQHLDSPHGRASTGFIGELSPRSETFRTRWAAHKRPVPRHGSQRVHDPVAGDLELAFETMQLAADDGLMMFVYKRPRHRRGVRSGAADRRLTNRAL